ncbi:MAG: tRNA epoxyqueuosine(34) reductase QueG [Rubripirellula sp.]
MIETLRGAADAEGFVLTGVAPAVAASGYANLVDWIESGYAAEMEYFAKRQQAYKHPASVLEGVKSIVVLAYPYSAANQASITPGQGRVARYVGDGVDYHDTIHTKLKRLCAVIQNHDPQASVRGVVDTAPLLEREFAQAAGLGWRGKNTLLLNKHLGSYFFLACVLTSIELPSDLSHESAHCGSCTACLDACPTDAFPSAGVLDANRCISYLTIEHRGSIPVELREGIGDLVFGCDICQEVCPWNRKPARSATRQPDSFDTLNLRELFEITEDEFRQRFRKTPLWRTRRRGVLRNAAIVLGNQRDAESVPSLTLGLNDEESIVRGAAAWALGRIASIEAKSALQSRRLEEVVDEVQSEIEAGLAFIDSQ